MEELRPHNDEFHLRADILMKNAEALNEINMTDHNFTTTEHVRRATAIYAFALHEYMEGGLIYGERTFGYEPIPLFDSATQDEIKRGTTPLSVRVHPDVAKALQECGVQENSANTHVLDNVLNHYASIARLNRRGVHIKIRKPSGEIQIFNLM